MNLRCRSCPSPRRRVTSVHFHLLPFPFLRHQPCSNNDHQACAVLKMRFDGLRAHEVRLSCGHGKTFPTTKSSAVILQGQLGQELSRQTPTPGSSCPLRTLLRPAPATSTPPHQSSFVGGAMLWNALQAYGACSRSHPHSIDIMLI